MSIVVKSIMKKKEIFVNKIQWLIRIMNKWTINLTIIIMTYLRNNIVDNLMTITKEVIIVIVAIYNNKKQQIIFN